MQGLLTEAFLSSLLFGAVTAGSFIVPGWKYYRQRARSRQRFTEVPAETTIITP